MDKINFENLPSTNTPVSAENLNLLQTNVDNAKIEKTINVSDPSTKNLNDYTTEGRYYFYAAPTNIPAGVNGFLEVFAASNGAVKQIWYRHGTPNTNDYETYVRTYSGSWSNWKKFNMINAMQTGSLTDLNSYFSSIDFNYVTKIGNIVQVNFRGLLGKNLPGGNTAYLKAPYGPSIGTAFTTVIFSGDRYSVSTPVWAYLDGSGNFRGSSIASGKYVHISFMYITPD